MRKAEIKVGEVYAIGHTGAWEREHLRLARVVETGVKWRGPMNMGHTRNDGVVVEATEESRKRFFTEPRPVGARWTVASRDVHHTEAHELRLRTERENANTARAAATERCERAASKLNGKAYSSGTVQISVAIAEQVDPEFVARKAIRLFAEELKLPMAGDPEAARQRIAEQVAAEAIEVKG